MWTFILIIVILGLFIILLGLAFVISLISSILGGVSNLWYILTGKKAGKTKKNWKDSSFSSSYSYGSGSSTNNNSGNSSSSDQEHSHSHKKGEKVFTADEGEYVAFEEVKE